MSYSGGITRSRLKANKELGGTGTSDMRVYFNERDLSTGSANPISDGAARVRYGDREMADTAKSVLRWRTEQRQEDAEKARKRMARMARR